MLITQNLYAFMKYAGELRFQPAFICPHAGHWSTNQSSSVQSIYSTRMQSKREDLLSRAGCRGNHSLEEVDLAKNNNTTSLMEPDKSRMSYPGWPLRTEPLSPSRLSKFPSLCPENPLLWTGHLVSSPRHHGKPLAILQGQTQHRRPLR